MEANVLASAISNVPHLAAFDVLANERFSNIDLDKLLVYIIDTVDASVLPYLAKQFDVLGYRGMRLATTEAQQRKLIKNAIQLKRYSGTPWAIKNALRSIGYPDAVLVENAGTGPYGWAEFEIKIDPGANPISAGQIDDLVNMLDIYKGARNHLAALSYNVNFDDAIETGDDSNEYPSLDDADILFAGGNFTYNGDEEYNGDHNYSSDSDVLDIVIINI